MNKSYICIDLENPLVRFVEFLHREGYDTHMFDLNGDGTQLIVKKGKLTKEEIAKAWKQFQKDYVD